MLLKFTHPKLLQTCMSFYLLLNTKKDILKNDWNFGTIDFHSIFFFLFKYGSQWCQTTVWFQSFFKVLQKKETHTGLQQLEGE